MTKLNFQKLLIESSVSKVTSEITLICWFGGPKSLSLLILEITVLHNSLVENIVAFSKVILCIGFSKELQFVFKNEYLL